MAIKSNNKQKSFEQSLWDTADKLRGTVESSEYKHVVLSLIFLKFVSDKFEARRQELIHEEKQAYLMFLCLFFFTLAQKKIQTCKHHATVVRVQ
jgi:type I restriction-modification system DNA methylase subunit